MNWPLILFTACLVQGIWIAEGGDWLSALPRLGVVAAIIILYLVFCQVSGKALHKPWMLTLTGLLCGILFFQGYTAVLVKPVRELDSQIFWAQAQVRDYPEVYEDSIRVELSVDAASIPSVHRNFKTMVYLPIEYKTMKPGDTVSFLAQFYQASVYDGFDKKSYLESKGFYTLATCKDSTGISVKSADRIPLWAYPKAVSHKIREAVRELYPEREAGFLTAILLGDKSGIQAEDYVALQKAGIVHVTAVSGMHVGFLIGFLLLLFGRRRGSLISVFFVIFFVFMAGASPSVMRAAIMYLVMAAAYWLDREASGLNSMFFALLVILIFNPYALFGLSLQLSFGATAGILLFSSKICKMIPGKSRHWPVQKLLTYGKQTLACTAGSMIFTTPILLMNFGYISVISVLTNLLVLPVVSVCFVIGYLSCLSSMLYFDLGQLLSRMVCLFLHYILGVSGLISRFSYAIVFANGWLCYGILAAMYVVLLLGYYMRHRVKPRFVVLGLLGLWLVAGLSGGLHSSVTSAIHILPSGYGQSILISGKNQELALVDGSGSGRRSGTQMVWEWMLLHNQERLDILVLTAVDKTHGKEAASLLEKIPVDTLILPKISKDQELEGEILQAAEKSQTKVIRCGTGEQEPIYYPAMDLKIYGDVEKKTVVQVGDVLIAHSLTQNMLAEFLEKRPLQAWWLVLSPSNLSDTDKLTGALNVIHPSALILESGYPQPEYLNDIMVMNPYTDGEISIAIETQN